jgi:uncharacterized membrane protein
MAGQSRLEQNAALAAGFAASLLVYATLPRPSALAELRFAWPLVVFLLPTTATVTAVLLGRLWWRDPVRERDEALERVYRAIIFRVVVFLLATHLVVLSVLSGVQWIQPWASRLVVVFAGLTLVAIGNVLPRTRPNVVIGIRTSRTLANRAAWIQMHRVTGYVSVGIGIVLVACGAFVPGRTIPGVTVAAGGIGLTVLLVQYGRLHRV